MGSYVPVTPEERRAMLERIGLPSVEALYADVPEGVLLKEPPVFTGGFSELEVRRHMERLAEQNRVFSTILRGAGAYDHYIPAIVRAIPSKEAFLTAYTPYQAEISQGLLQSIFEYQTMICRLTGMDVANASVYDGASPAAEACAMVRERRRTVTLVSACAHPDVIATIRTYCWGSNHEMRLIPEKDGVTDLDALRGALDDQVSGVYPVSYTHLDVYKRQVLGSVLGLGIRRSCVGDIVVLPDRAYLFLESQLADHVALSLTSAGRVQIRTRVLEAWPEVEPPQGVEVRDTVSSLRLDAVDRKSTRLNSSHSDRSRMPSSA